MPSVCCKCRQAIWRDASLAGYGLNPVLNKVYILVTEIIFLYRENQCEETGRQVPQYVNNLSLMSFLADFFLVPRNTQEPSYLILLLCICLWCQKVCTVLDSKTPGWEVHDLGFALPLLLWNQHFCFHLGGCGSSGFPVSSLIRIKTRGILSGCRGEKKK